MTAIGGPGRGAASGRGPLRNPARETHDLELVMGAMGIGPKVQIDIDTILHAEEMALDVMAEICL